MPNWTNEQKQAILSKGNNILVAAAAGSGKTAVLVERIINKVINEKVDIDKLLVVTFTNAAAAEMRERVLNVLYERQEETPDDEWLQRQITLLNVSNICTIDSFCLQIVRNHFYELENVSPNFRIADVPEIELLKQEILDEMFEKKYEEEDEDFSSLINTYTTYRDDTPLKDLILKIYNFISSNPFPEKWLNEKFEMFNLKDSLDVDFSKTIWGKIILEEVSDEVEDELILLKDLENSLSYDIDLEDYKNAISSDIKQLETLKNNLDSWDNTYEIVQNLNFITWPRKKVENDLKDEAKKVRDQIKEKIKKLKKLIISNSREANEDIYSTYDILIKLKNLILEFNNIFANKKREKNIVDFSDIEHFALSILLKEDEKGIMQKSDVAKRYAEKFEEIAIDEYQDSNLVQENILRAVSKENNIFMVGDVKQSIYKFRQAMPDLFLEKYENYKNIEINGESGNIETNEKRENIKTYGESKNIEINEESENIEINQENENIEINQESKNKETNEKSENIHKAENNLSEATKIQLFKNFRSRDNVLNFTNLVFQDIMSKKMGEVQYEKNEYLNFGATDYKEINQDLKTEIDIINIPKSQDEQIPENKDEEPEDDSETVADKAEYEKMEDIELEAKFIASKIKELVKSKYQVYNRKTKQFQDIKYSDIVILLRSTKEKANIYEQQLINLKIPVFSDSTEQYLDTIEVQTIINLLKIIDNPIQDIPLVAVLRSNIGGFTDDDLVQIRLSDKNDKFYECLKKARINVPKTLKEKIDKFLENLQTWQKEKEYLALDELIWKIYTDTGYYNFVGLMPNGNLRQANLRMLFEKATQYEGANFKGLYNFIQFIEKISQTSGDMGSAKIIGENDDVVRIMSIHKSKGLEFPIVFVANCNKQFNMQELKKDSVLLHQDLGLGAKYIDYNLQVRYDTLTREAVKRKIELENIAEEMRVLYVALTRAKEKLFITGVVKNYEEKLEKLEKKASIYEKTENKINPILVKASKSYFEWIMLVILYESSKKDIFTLNVINKEDCINIIKNTEQEEKESNYEDMNEIIIDENTKNQEEQENIRKILEYKYPYYEASKIKTKMSVTEIKELENEKNEEKEQKQGIEKELKQGIETELEQEIEKGLKHRIEKELKQERKKELKSEIEEEKLKQKIENKSRQEIKKELEQEIEQKFLVPKFINNNNLQKTISSARKGTVMHLCMQKLDNKKEYNLESLKELVEALKTQNLITEEEAKTVNLNKILEFTKSKIGQELKNAKKIYKEKPFYINIKSQEIFKEYENINEDILVQGIIDLYYITENDEIILVDYKTDYVNPGEENKLVSKYIKQIQIYKEALERALNKKVDRAYIYSIYLNEEISV